MMIILIVVIVCLYQLCNAYVLVAVLLALWWNEVSQ